MKQFMDEGLPAVQRHGEDSVSSVRSPDAHSGLPLPYQSQEIYEDRRFDNITQVWLGGDHYKWRVMRSNGVEEKYITGDASDREKFQKFAEALPKCIGNPMYHWCHLELKRYFGYNGILNGDNRRGRVEPGQ